MRGGDPVGATLVPGGVTASKNDAVGELSCLKISIVNLRAMPAFLPSPQRAILGWLAAMPLLLTPPYLVSNRLTWREALAVPLTDIDRWVPFRPDLVWCYLGLFPLMWLAVLLQPNVAAARRVVLGMAGCALVAGVVFALWPTCFPRDGLPAAPDGHAGFGLRLIHALDTERNACPSLHGCYAVSSALWIARARGAAAGWLAALAAAAIILATIAVRQHGVIDLAAGGVLGAASVLGWRWRDRALRPAEEIAA